MVDILTKDEIKLVAATLKSRRARENALLNLAIFRLSACCGLRRCEISGLIMSDFLDSPTRPFLRIRSEATKGEAGKRRGRVVPLFWDKGTLEDIRAWVEVRKRMGASASDPLVCCLKGKHRGSRLNPAKISLRWRYIVRMLGPDRAKLIPCHSGRRTFLSHALAAGKSLVEVRDAAGHRDVKTTSIYLYAIETETPDIFA